MSTYPAPHQPQQSSPTGNKPISQAVSPMSITRLLEKKALGEPIVMITAYDYPSASVVEDAGVDIVLVGDSAAMVVLGYPNTTPVSMRRATQSGRLSPGLRQVAPRHARSAAS